MKPLPVLLSGLLFVSSLAVSHAAQPVPSAATPEPAAKPATKGAPAPKPQAAAAPAPTPVKAPLVIDDYVAVLVEKVGLSDAEKKEIEDLYNADGPAIKKIGDDATLSPLQKAQQIADLRNTRNGKIEDLLHNLDRKQAFDEVEVVYRVDVTELALNGGLGTPPPAPTAPASAPAPAAPASTATPPAPPQ